LNAGDETGRLDAPRTIDFAFTNMSNALTKNDVKSVYAKLAPFYDFFGTLFESRARRRCFELADVRDGDAVLEVGVGTGLMFAKVVQSNPSGRNEGVDLTPEMLVRAGKRLEKLGASNYRLAIADAYSLPYPDNTFDVLLNNFMFDLLPESDFNKVLLEFKRVLRPGGRLAMANMTKGTHWYHSLPEWIYRVSPRLMGGCRGISLDGAVKDAGFSLARREVISEVALLTEIILAAKPR
jgi:ubiquinone/menaquinone biosynthesis C-methylase UbiE